MDTNTLQWRHTAVSYCRTRGGCRWIQTPCSGGTRRSVTAGHGAAVGGYKHPAVAAHGGQLLQDTGRKEVDTNTLQWRHTAVSYCRTRGGRRWIQTPCSGGTRRSVTAGHGAAVGGYKHPAVAAHGGQLLQDTGRL